jgi:hypothetical protein
VVKAPLTGGTDVHTGPLTDRFQAFENLDRTRVVSHAGVFPSVS